MDLDVVDEQLRVLIPNVADGAEEHFVLLVVVELVEMLHQLFSRVKDHCVAKWTRSELVLLVVAHVLVEVRLLAVRSLADVAPELLLRTVDLHVNRQTRSLRELLVAVRVRAAVGPLPRMCPRVGTQTSRLSKGFSANLK